ncbi:MAG: hypothetical protein ACI837_001828 [Crocinitomicaceae bacterium]|jgi:uncharacterized protein YggE
MKKKTLLLLAMVISIFTFGQNSGNVNYQLGNTGYGVGIIPNVNQTKMFGLPDPRTNDLFIVVNGLSNIVADTYVAIFHVTQVGVTADEVNRLLTNRVDKVTKDIKAKDAAAKVYVDMLSFVPMYEYDVEKKVFSKKTYNETPKGFELKKNIHIQFNNPESLNDFIAICTESEIYDLVKVDYICTDLAAKKKELAAKAMTVVKEKIARFTLLLDTDLSDVHRLAVEDYQVYYPLESYASYEAYSSTSLDLKKTANVNTAAKSRTQYYQSIPSKEFDFILNPIVLEPVIQVVYQVKLKIAIPPKSVVVAPVVKQGKEYVLITPNGDLKTLQIVK